ncbi:hemolysin family protein [Campylobacter canadensis]|uniref:HlyC/CorC family transporter n=1 Tax=Campylobacter canadensis TaxID=449520 RepID=A0ABS7WVZ7_9BACT|nr:hemolysin family protein [Campylobacter canadensis]MBZ7988145.1 HlyC/CorC family transporter [Campylobacter canadensis]MBZ7995595.1 HlyC/CorC family transporter [Campylobacter canadensis]MBZ7997392.1 HlyC/CorC family transporter [Campylobacter canadensis]MBZ7999134.1 HlyC/CorC family transporter [Campylobacter canadensis]MBZ8000936.1 HlyC/CorC family transporter [Campylobacter canadensis]
MLFLALFCVFLNAFFVLSEFSIVKVRKSKLEELANSGNSSAKLALNMYNHLDTYLSATQLGITLSSLALGWLGESSVATILSKLLSSFNVNPVAIHSISVVISFIFITLMHVVLGEIVPKSIAIAKTEKVVLIISRPLYYFRILFAPFIISFDYLSIGILKIFGIKTNIENAHTEEEIKIIASESQRSGVLDEFETEIIQNAVDFSDIVAKEIMTPRRDMICLNKISNYEENLKIVKEFKHTRFPYIDASKDNILGMIHIRDLLDNSDLNSCVRNVLFVPENLSISKILLQMNKEQIHTAIVVDEYGGTAGLLTMEDIIEELVGEISDEHDIKSQEIKKISDNVYIVNGRLDIESVEELLGIKFDDDLEELTIGGYVFNRLGHMPSEKERCEDEFCYYEVKSMHANSIKLLKIIKKG